MNISHIQALVLAKWKVILAVLATLFVMGFIVYQTVGTAPTATEENDSGAVREVEVRSIRDLSSSGGTLSLVGTVRSQNEATIRSEASGEIVGLYYELGDYVTAGSAIAEMNNSRERAAVLSAEGALDAAKASLAKIQGGTREEQLAILKTSLDSAKSGAFTSLLSAYAAVDSAVNDATDGLFTGVEIGQTTFVVPTSNLQTELDLENRRNSIEAILQRQTAATRTLSSVSDLAGEITRTEAEVREIRTFVDIATSALSQAIVTAEYSETEIAALKAQVTGARTALTATLSALSGAKGALAIAEKNLEQGVSGAQAEDVAAVEATVKQAQGAYNAALSNLDKTIIRAPISGSLNSLSIERGDVVTAFQEVAIVSNNGSLEAVAYITEEDRSTLRVGARALIENAYEGTVVRIAGAIDPSTRKIEIRIALPESAEVVNGESVRIAISREGEIREDARLMVPISAIKMNTEGTFVFSVNQEKRLVAHKIETGPLSGNSIEITKGIAPDVAIVLDARGLNEGDVVDVKN